MRAFSRIASLAVLVALLLWLVPATSGAAPAENAIITSSVSAACVDGSFQVTMSFTHRGSVEARFYTVKDGVRNDSDHAWYRGHGLETYATTLAAQTGVSFEAHLLRIDRPERRLVDVVPYVTLTGPYSCS